MQRQSAIAGHDLRPVTSIHPSTGRSRTCGQETFPASSDELEQALVEEAERKDLPILGICRELQMLNVTRGGTLYHTNTSRGTGKLRAQRTTRARAATNGTLRKATQLLN